MSTAGRETTLTTAQGTMTLCLKHWGPDTGRPVLILHGFLDQSAAWDAVAVRLGRRVVAPDHRGHGRSGHVGDGGFYHFWDYVSDVDHVVQHLGGHVDIVGHSMGGSIACLFAATRPESVGRLILVEGLGPPDASHRRVAQAQTFLAHRRVPPRHQTMRSLDEAAERMRKAVPSLTLPQAQTLAARVTRTVGNTNDIVWRWDALHRSRSPRTFETEVFLSFLEAIDSRTLVIQGAQSSLIVDDIEQRIRALGPERHCVLEGGHNLHHDAPHALSKEIAAFLSEGAS